MPSRSEILMKSGFGISDRVIDLGRRAEKEIEEAIAKIERVREINQLKVIKALQDNGLSDSHFAGSTGYGYGDRGREVLDGVFAQVFKAEAALVRQQMVAGTHALAVCMYGILRPGDELLSVTGKPYDTLEEVIGLRGRDNGSLKEFGISYEQVDLTPGGGFDLDGIRKAINGRTRMVYIQKSRGYGWRPSLRAGEIEKITGFIKGLKQEIVILVDNCYGEFVEEREPTEAGADLVAGSLIKNPGGGLAPTGGYIAGRSEYVSMASYRLTTPGLGKEVGATLGHNRQLFQGVFMAPHVVAESLKGAAFCGAVMGMLGFETSPLPGEERGDIIQAVRFDSAVHLIAFCQGIQKGSAVDSFVTPQPWDMPGYDCPVIMAAGAFIQGASIELSADAPIKPPYIAYMQGGLVYEGVKLGVLKAVQMMMDNGLVSP